MGFNNGKFIKGKIYNYREDPNNSEKVFVTTEEGKEQDLWYTELDMLFTFLKN